MNRTVVSNSLKRFSCDWKAINMTFPDETTLSGWRDVSWLEEQTLGEGGIIVQ